VTTPIELGTPTQYDYRLPRLRHELSRPFLPSSPDAALLDFGCGNGANTVLFAEDFATVVGVDVEAERVEQAKAEADRLGLSNVSYQCYDGARLPFEDASFDHVVSFEVLEHTRDDSASVAEIRRVLKPEGMITISVPNKWYLMETHGFDLRPRWVKWNRVPLMSWLPTPLHERYAKARIYTKRRVVDLLRQHGFDVVAHRYVMPPFDIVSRPRVKQVLDRSFTTIGRTPLRVIGVAHFLAARKA
jgi:ubiquinone/menaquinone biosynthesis C-methylase UbiE